MKFVFEYRTSDNVLHQGEIVASDRESAFNALKSRGIRPCRLWVVPGALNWLFSRWVRRAVAVLLIGLAALWIVRSRPPGHEASPEANLADDSVMYEPRGQIYGDPVVLQRLGKDGWKAVFTDVGDRHLAAHAVPGLECGCPHQAPESVVHALEGALSVRYEDKDSEYDEVRRIKRKVNWMKREVEQYVKEGGTVREYLIELDRRQREEISIVSRVRTEFQMRKDVSVLEDRNRELRAMGLPMIPYSIEEADDAEIIK